LWPKLSNPEVSGEKHMYFWPTFLKLDSISAGFGRILSQDSQILAF